MNRRIVSIIMLLVFTVLCFGSALPAAARTEEAQRYATPAGYNDNDYQKLVAFMEMKDDQGVLNGVKIVSYFNGYYIPTYPESWGYYYYDHEIGMLYSWGVFWAEDDKGELRVCQLDLYDMGLVGELDVSGCTELYEAYCDKNAITSINASGCADMRALMCADCELAEIDITGCAGLDLFDCSGNRLTRLDASDCVNVYDIECHDNKLAELDVSGCERLGWLNCCNNYITELDLSACGELYFLNCLNDPLKELDLSMTPMLWAEHIAAEGDGFISYSGSEYGDEYAIAAPADGAEFLGWYDETGGLITAGLRLDMSGGENPRATARFTASAALPGDADGSGAVNANDALTVLRYSLGLVSEINAEAADVNGDGAVNANDALMILRMALGLN